MNYALSKRKVLRKLKKKRNDYFELGTKHRLLIRVLDDLIYDFWCGDYDYKPKGKGGTKNEPLLT